MIDQEPPKAQPATNLSTSLPSQNLSNGSLLRASFNQESPRAESFTNKKTLQTKSKYEKIVKKYYHQLTIGCQNEACNFKLCCSCPKGPKLTRDASAIMAMQLASKPKKYFCPRLPETIDSSCNSKSGSGTQTPKTQSTTPLMMRKSSSMLVSSSPPHLASQQSNQPWDALSNNQYSDHQSSNHHQSLNYQSSNHQSKPFLYSLLSSSPFASLFGSMESSMESVNDATTHPSNEFTSDPTHDSTGDSTSDPTHELTGDFTSDINQSDSGIKDKRSSSNSNFGITSKLGSKSNFGSTSNLCDSELQQKKTDMKSNDSNPDGSVVSVDHETSTMKFSLLYGLTGSLLSESKSSSVSFLDDQEFVQSTHSLHSLPSTHSLQSTHSLHSVQTSQSNQESNEKDQNNLFTGFSELNLDEKQVLCDYLDERNVQSLFDEQKIQDKNQIALILSTLKHIFSSSDCLNKSFVVEKCDSVAVDTKIGGYLVASALSSSQTTQTTKTSNTSQTTKTMTKQISPAFTATRDKLTLPTHPSGIDLSALRLAYATMLSQSSLYDQVALTLVNAMEILIAKLHMNIFKLHNVPSTFLRQLLVLIENPLLYSTSTDDAPLKKLLLVLGNLRGKSKQTIIHWFSMYDSITLDRIIDLTQRFLINHFTCRDDDGNYASLKFLSLLHKASTLSNLVPMNAFYNEQLIKRINFKDEYKIWKKLIKSTEIHTRSRSQPHILMESTTQLSSFSYFQYPFLFDPIAKTRIMHIDAMVQMSQEFEDAFVNQALVIHAQRFLPDSTTLSDFEQSTKQATNPYLVLEVSRERLVEDTMDQLKMKQMDLKKPIRIKFSHEEGMDQGGVQKEFFQVLINKLLDPAHGMFVYDEETRLCWINGASLEALNHFQLVGTILGLALYNGVMLDVNFPMLLYKKLLNEQVTLFDLKDAFPSLGRGLEQLLQWKDGNVADVFMRTFEISYDVYGKVLNFPLVEGGQDLMVNNENRFKYVDLYIKHYTNLSVKKQFESFQKGFLKVVGGDALHLCKAQELELLLCGVTSTELDFKELESGCEYDDGYNPDHQVIKWFWSIVHNEMSFEQKKMLLNFVTASDRVPLRGLGKLTFVVQRNGPDTNRLPTALTCFGRLLLPEYSDREKLKNRVITAIENAKGFGLV